MKVAWLLAVLCCTMVSAEILFEENFSGPFDPANPNSQWFTSGLPPIPYVLPNGVSFNKCAISNSDNQGSLSLNPVQRPSNMFPGMGWFSNELCDLMPKAFYNPITVDVNQTVSYSAKMATQRGNINLQPFGSDSSDPISDPRFGTCGIILYSPTMGVANALFMTSSSIWSYHARPKYPWSNSGNWKGFFNMKKIAHRDSHKFNELKIEYDRSTNTVRYIVDDKVKRTITRVGSINQEDGINVAEYAYDINERVDTNVVELPDLMPILACLSQMDKTDPNDITSLTGLVNHYTPDEFFLKPSSWFSNNANSANDQSLHEFGQTLEAQIRNVKIERCY